VLVAFFVYRRCALTELSKEKNQKNKKSLYAAVSKSINAYASSDAVGQRSAIIAEEKLNKKNGLS